MSLSPAPTLPESPQILLRLEADFSEDGQFGRRILEVSPTHVRMFDLSGVTLFEAAIADLKAARSEPLVSGGRILIQSKSGEETELVTYSMAQANHFSDAARGIEQLIEGKEFTIVLKDEKTRCEKCGRLLPEKDGVCPHCVNRGKTMLRIASFLTPYKKQGISLIIAASFSTIATLIPPRIQGTILDHFESGHRSIPFLTQMVLFWTLATAIATGIQILNNRLMTYLGTHISSDLRTTVYKSIEFLQVNYFDKKSVGAISSRVTQDTERVWFFLVDGLPFLVINGLMLIAVVAILFSINWVLALCILSPIPFVAWISMSVWKPISGLFHRASQKMARVHMHLNESLNGIRVVKAFAKEDHEFAKFAKRSDELRDAAKKADMTWYTYFGAMSFCVSMGAVIHWAVGGWMLYTGRLTLGQFYMVNAYLAMVYGPLQWFAQVNDWFSRAMAGAERIFEIIDMTPEPSLTGGKEMKVRGKVTFEEVRFGYDKSNPAIKNVSLKWRKAK